PLSYLVSFLHPPFPYSSYHQLTFPSSFVSIDIVNRYVQSMMLLPLFILFFLSINTAGQESKRNESTIGILKNQTIRPCEGQRANDSNCTVHVFRVVLSSKPSDSTTETVNKEKIIFANSAQNKELSREVSQKIPKNLSESIRKRIKNVIENDGFFLRETNPEELPSSESNLSEMNINAPIDTQFLDQPKTDSVSVKTGVLSIVSTSFSPWWLAILVVGIVMGVLSTVFCILLIEYRSKPMLDRSSQLSFRKVNVNSKGREETMRRDVERLIPIVVPNYYTPDYRAPPPPLLARSVSSTASSSHPNYVNSFSLLDNHQLAMAYAPPPVPRGREGRYVRRGMRPPNNAYEMQLYNNIMDGSEGRGRSSSTGGSIR
ncbi:hypothetical protein PFISCL1PPCAC_20039, partial [Pristionchus fissidentatus]